MGDIRKMEGGVWPRLAEVLETWKPEAGSANMYDVVCHLKSTLTEAKIGGVWTAKGLAPNRSVRLCPKDISWVGPTEIAKVYPSSNLRRPEVCDFAYEPDRDEDGDCWDYDEDAFAAAVEVYEETSKVWKEWSWKADLESGYASSFEEAKRLADECLRAKGWYLD